MKSVRPLLVIVVSLLAVVGGVGDVVSQERPRAVVHGENVMYGRLTQFFKLVSEGKVREGYEALTKGSKLITDVDGLVTKTNSVIRGNGDIVDAELLRTTRVGKRLLRISYLTHGDIYPLQWNFYCYRSSNGWQVLDITVNNDLYDIFDEEEEAQQTGAEERE